MKVLVNQNGLVETVALPAEAEQSSFTGLLLVEAPEDIIFGDHYEASTATWIRDSFLRDEPAPPDPEPTPEERLAALERENKTLTAQLEAMIQSNQMLEDCLVEMAGVVYA